jgi:hypothetical protein
VAQAFVPFGLRNVANMGSHGNEIRQYPLPNGSTCPNLGRGSPVKFTGGVITSLGSGGGPILGVAHGFAYIDPTTKRLTHASQIPQGTSSGGLVDGETRPIAYITDSSEALFTVQANATVSSADFGLNFDLTAASGDVDQVYGVSRYALKASSRSSAIGLPVRIVGIAKITDNAWKDPYPIVVVKLNTIMAQVSAS